jgi:hypothetical protein
METKTRAAGLTDFCLVLTPTRSAAGRASQAILKRFEFLGEEISRDLAAVVAELVHHSVERGVRRPITVTIAVDAGAIHGEVSDRGNPVVAAQMNGNGNGTGLSVLDQLTSRWGVHDGSTDAWFEIPLSR